jgi:hypothetical protein
MYEPSPMLKAVLNSILWNEFESVFIETETQIRNAIFDGRIKDDPCLTRFAKWWNARHPGRRVSARRLSRPQRKEAYFKFYGNG